MARPVSISDEQILEAAQQLILEKGLDATTLEIAQHAGVSEGTVFKRFKTKEQLFVAVLTHDLFQHSWIQVLHDYSGRGDVRANLELIAERMLNFYIGMVPKMHMIMSRHGDLKQKLMKNPDTSPPLNGIRQLERFLKKERELGRLKPHNSEHYARILISTMHHFAVMESMDINQYLTLSKEEHIRQTIAVLFEPLILE